MSNATPSPVEPTPAPHAGLALVLQSSKGSFSALDAVGRPPVLEVASIWSDQIADVQHIRCGARPVTGGSSTGTRWRVFGVPMAWVPRGFGNLAWVLAPLFSEVSEEWKSDLFVPSEHLPEDEFALFHSEDGTFVGRFQPEWDGFLDDGSERVSFAALIAQGRARPDGTGSFCVALDEDTRMVAALGDVVLVSRLVPESTRIRPRPGANLDPVFIGIFSLAAAVFALLMMVLWTTPPPPESAVATLDDRVASLVLSRPLPVPLPSKPSTSTPKQDAGARSKGAEGSIGRKNARQKEASGAPRPISKKQLDRQVAAQAGVLGVLSDNAAMSALFSSSALSTELTGGLGTAMGAKGIRLGSGGLSTRGGAFGGGGQAQFIGGTGLEGRGRGRQTSIGDGENYTEKTTGALTTTPADPVILGALDRSLIDEVVKRHMNQIRYCYQRALTRSPDLSGKVTVKFVIGGDGSVSSAKVRRSTLHDSAVETCITNRFMRFSFPEPKGNGMVIVSYPFVFSAG